MNVDALQMMTRMSKRSKNIDRMIKIVNEDSNTAKFTFLKAQNIFKTSLDLWKLTFQKEVQVNLSLSHLRW